VRRLVAALDRRRNPDRRVLGAPIQSGDKAPHSKRTRITPSKKENPNMSRALIFLAWCSLCLPSTPLSAAPPLQPVVEAEEDVYRYEPANNGAGPMWCSGSTCLVRIGENVFASGLETLAERKPLNNCRWLLLQRGAGGWELQQADPHGRTREPCPLAAFHDGRLFLSANPTLTPVDQHAGPARPEILQFDSARPKAPFQTILPQWDGEPAFSEH